MSQKPAYPFAEIEERVQRQWSEQHRYRATEDPAREKFYCLAMFPYPSGRLHMGHVRNYTISDAIARYQRQLGRNVLHPIGWDAFGLPAENAAVERGIDPRQWTLDNIGYMRDQLKRMGISYDWGRELSTCEPDYYRWEQWLFTRLYRKGMVYRQKSEVNWDPVDQTVLANEQVIEGRGWRSGAPVQRRSIEQWFLRITDYAQELLDGLDRLDGWPAEVVQMQRNWLGRSQGASIVFDIAPGGEGSQGLEVYTTRADTLFGVVALGLSREHPLVKSCAASDAALAKALEEMAAAAGATSEAALANAPKLGHRLDIEAVHPLSGDRLPVYVSNYVLAEYGSGAVMLVPAHDQRDFEFAQQYGIAPCAVVLPADGSLDANGEAWTEAYTEDGVLHNCAEFSQMDSAQAREAICDKLESLGKGARAISWRLRDWGVSRQRYWGCPIPMEYGENGEPRPSEQLPVSLPQLQPQGSGKLMRLADHPDFSPERSPRRETDTLDTFFESSWYYARFCCPDCDTAMFDERVRHWLPVDQYVGGIEHAVLHLLYFRFFHKLMRDEGLVEGDEPALRLLTQGMVVAHSWSIDDESGRRVWVNADEVDVERGGKGEIVSATHRPSGRAAKYEGVNKMSKSLNNGVDPDMLIERYGSDATRMYTLFAAPPEQSLEWSSEGISGCTRFLDRLYSFVDQRLDALAKASASQTPAQLAAANRADERLASWRRRIHSLLGKALHDYQRNQFNTVVAGAMEMMKILSQCEVAGAARDEFLAETLSIVLRLLAPIAPHISEELWSRIHQGQCIEEAGFPEVDEAALERDSIDLVVQVNGRKRAQATVAVDADDEQCRQAAIESCRDSFGSEGKITKVIVVGRKLVNIVYR